MPFGYTTAAQWLASRAHEYGFVLAYPSGQEADTGYEWEPWHYRYVGIENAERITQGRSEPAGISGPRKSRARLLRFFVGRIPSVPEVAEHKDANPKG